MAAGFVGRRRIQQVTAGVMLALSWSVVGFSQSAARPDGLIELLADASAWTTTFIETFSSALIEERYEQVERSHHLEVAKRTTRAEMLLLRLDTPGWVHFRDVFEVNGRPVVDRRDRLQRLFLDSPDTALQAARRLTNESSRYNLNAVHRTINIPTFGLLPLDESYAARFEFGRAGDERVNGLLATRVRFAEKRGRSLVKTLKGEDVPIEGTIWIEARTGRVLQTLVKTHATADPGQSQPPFDGATLMWVQTIFGPLAPSNVWAPIEMREWTRSSDLVELSGTAYYSNLREFVVDTATSYKVQGR